MTNETKTCPFCAETIKSAAIKCRYCLSDLPAPEPDDWSDRPTSKRNGRFLELGAGLEPISIDETTWTLTTAAREEVRRLAQELEPGFLLRVNWPMSNGTPREWSIFPDDEHLKADRTVVLHFRGREHDDPDELIQIRIDSWTWTEIPGLTMDFTYSTGFTYTRAPRGNSQISATPDQHESGTVPLTQWRGLGKMTRQASVPAHCSACRHEWHLDASIANTIAQEQGLGGRLQRAGTKLEQFGATFSPGSAGRRIAAGNERQRLSESLTALYSLAACPKCKSTDVLLTKP